jgi:hypothetical protein
MTHQPQDTRPLGPTGEGDGSTPPLREFSPKSDPDSDAARAPWSAFVARILRPASVGTGLNQDPD